MRIAVVIPQYIISQELADLAENCLKSFQNNSPTDTVLISVDDGSTIKENKIRALSNIYLENKINLGFGPTCNKGFKWIFDNFPEEDLYIICANNDIEINKRVIPALIRPFEMFENVALTGIVSTKAKIFEGQPLEEYHGNMITDGGLIKDWMQDGGLWMSKKSILQKIGIFDEQFEVGGFEDVDLFLRARDTFGMKIVMSNLAVYWHKQGATRWYDQMERINKGHEEKNHQKFIHKWDFDPQQKNPWRAIEIWRN